MQTFENDLCTTVDAILAILGHKPKVVRDPLLLQQPSSGTTGADFSQHSTLPSSRPPIVRPHKIDLTTSFKPRPPLATGKAQLDSDQVLKNV